MQFHYTDTEFVKVLKILYVSFYTYLVNVNYKGTDATNRIVQQCVNALHRSICSHCLI